LLFTDIQATDAGFDLIVLALTMVIIGGFGSWRGALVGAILLTWIPLKLTSIGEWWDVVYGALMIFVATFAPGGLFGLWRDLTRRVSGSKSGQDPARLQGTAIVTPGGRAPPSAREPT